MSRRSVGQQTEISEPYREIGAPKAASGKGSIAFGDAADSWVLHLFHGATTFCTAFADIMLLQAFGIFDCRMVAQRLRRSHSYSGTC